MESHNGESMSASRIDVIASVSPKQWYLSIEHDEALFTAPGKSILPEKREISAIFGTPTEIRAVLTQRRKQFLHFFQQSKREYRHESNCRNQCT